MKISTACFVEHRVAGHQHGGRSGRLRPMLVLPGACTSCNGSSSTSSCCCGTKDPEIRVVRSFAEAARIFPEVQVPAQLGGVNTLAGRSAQTPGG